MDDDAPRSDVFFGPRPLTKKQQEAEIARALLQLYVPQCDPADVPNGPCPNPTPPDWLFEFGDVLVGVEMTEVDQYYGLRSKERTFTDLIYAEFHSRNIGFDPTGLSVGVLRSEQALAVASGKVLRKAAQEVVELVSKAITSVEDLRPLLFRHVRIDEYTYPDLFNVASSISLGCGPDGDIRRSDGKAAPIVIMEGGMLVNKELGVVWHLERLVKKCQDKRRSNPPTGWGRVAHSVLLFHDYPRKANYTFAGKDFIEEYLREAVVRAPEADHVTAFDEILLLTYRRLEFELVQITGSRLSGLHTRRQY